jgi:hypothetical protein
MSLETPQPLPDTLYRGITLPIDHVHESLLTNDIRPGEEPYTNEQGRKTVADGNEYGVYMTDNAHMSEVAYATPRHGTTMPDSPSFNWKGSSQSRVQMPRVGVMYEINTEGLDARSPFIKDSLRGHYNNGFGGDEYIADSVPAANHRVTKLKIGSDILHEARDIEVGEEQQQAFDEVRREAAYRSGRLAIASQIISEMPGNLRSFPGTVERALANLQ